MRKKALKKDFIFLLFIYLYHLKKKHSKTTAYYLYMFRFYKYIYIYINLGNLIFLLNQYFIYIFSYLIFQQEIHGNVLIL